MSQNNCEWDILKLVKRRNYKHYGFRVVNCVNSTHIHTRDNDMVLLIYYTNNKSNAHKINLKILQMSNLMIVHNIIRSKDKAINFYLKLFVCLFLFQFSDRVAVIIFGILTLIAGILLSSIPWLDYFILKNLRLWNNSLSFHYWQRPGVIRLTKLYIFNVTNPDQFLAGDKPKLVEVGPFTYR